MHGEGPARPPARVYFAPPVINPPANRGLLIPNRPGKTFLFSNPRPPGFPILLAYAQTPKKFLKRVRTWPRASRTLGRS